MRCIHIGLLAFCISISAACAQAPKHPLTLVPADVPYYYHLDFEAMDKAKLGADLKLVKSFKVQQWIDSQSNMWCLIPFLELKSQTYFVEPQPSDRGIDSQVTINVARTKLDLEAVGKRIESYKRYAKKPVQNKASWTFESGKDSLVTYDLSTTDRWVIWDRLKSRAFPKAGGEGVHADLLPSQEDAICAFGLDIGAVPKEMRNPASLPKEMKFAAPAFEAKGVWLDGRVIKDQFVLNITVAAKSKQHVAELIEVLKTGKPLLVMLIQQAVRDFATTQVKPKPLLAWVDILNKSITDAEVSSKDNSLKIVLSLPMKESLLPVMNSLAGGGGFEDTVTGNQLKQLGNAFFKESLERKSAVRAALTNGNDEKLLSWRVYMLQHLGEMELYKKFKLDEPWDSKNNKKIIDENPIPDIYATEGADRNKVKTTRFQVFTGKNALFDDSKAAWRFGGIGDGTSNTGLVYVAETPVEWTKPEELVYDADTMQHVKKIWFDKTGRTTFVTITGDVVSVSSTKMSEKLLKALITPNGHEKENLRDD